MISEAVLEEVAERLAARMRGRDYGQIHVVDVAGEVITDVDGYLAVQLNYVFNKPDGETWPPDDIADLRRDVRAEARTFPGEFFVYVWFRPVGDEDQESETIED